MKEFYQVRLWCSDDSCEEFWFYKDLSPVFDNIDAAEQFLRQYEGKTASEIEKMCDCVSVRSNRPKIYTIPVEYSSNGISKIFTDEQLGMLADCILAQIKAWAMVGDSVAPNVELEALKTTEMGKLKTLLDYILTDVEE